MKTDAPENLAEDKNFIPPITDPMGRHWSQPSPREILLDDTHALMTQWAFEKLAEYSSTIPTGVYPGKMWKRHDGVFDRDCKPEDRRWLLVWFGESEDPQQCTINAREILIA